MKTRSVDDRVDLVHLTVLGPTPDSVISSIGSLTTRTLGRVNAGNQSRR